MKTIRYMQRPMIPLLLAALCLSTLCLPLQSCAKSPEKKDALYTEATPNTTLSPEDDITASRQNAITRAVAKCSPAIVGINVTEVREYRVNDPWSEFFGQDPMFERYFGRPRTYQQEIHGLGSGYIISADGYILTNHHVAGNAKKVIVTMTNGEKYDARLIGADLVTDVALLKIDGKNFPYLRLANSDNVVIGEWAIAFGNPFGLFDINAKPTVTVGVVSNTGVSFVQENRVYRDMIQTDAAISSGNSGGPLVNAEGDVIGMNTVIFSTAQNATGAGSIGIGFAIPINRVKKVVDILKNGKEIDRDFSPGFDVQLVDEKIAQYLNLDRVQGVVISRIIRYSPAEKAGLEPGDIILDIDGQRISREEDVLIIVNDAVVGQTLTLTISRGKEKLKKTLVLERRR